MRSVIVAMGAGTDSKVNRMRLMDHDFPAVADFTLARRAVESAERRGKAVRVGSVFSTDFFYHPQPQFLDGLERMGMLAVEMEVAGLYGVAAEFGARALALLTVSDQIRLGQSLTPEERQLTFDEMIEVALDVAAAEASPGT